MNSSLLPIFLAGMVLSLSLIMAIGPQNAHVMRMGLRRQHLWLTIAVCVLTDFALIGAGVAGLAQLGSLSDPLLGAMTGAGALVLVLYGAQALRRFLRPGPAAVLSGSILDSRLGSQSGSLEPSTAPDATSAAATPAAAMSRREAIGLALALSWLNPHAWLDTAVLIGTASLAYAAPANAVFGVGAAAGSALWFLALGSAMWLLGRRLDSPTLWRLLDLLVAVMMWGTAAWLLAGLLA